MTRQETNVYDLTIPSSDLPQPTSYHQLFAYRSRTNPNDVWFYYPEPEGAKYYKELTYKGANDLIGHLAAQYAEILPKADESTISKTAPKSIPEPPMVVTTLASNKVQLVLTGLAAYRLQHACLHMSPSSSDTGIISLLQSVDSKVLIADDVFYARAEKLATQVEGLRLVRMIDFDPLDELKKDLKIFDFDLNRNEGLNSSIILHANNSFSFSPPSVIRRATLTTGLV